MTVNQIGIKLSLDGAKAVQSGLDDVSNKLGTLDSSSLKVGDAFARLGSAGAGLASSLKGALLGLTGAFGFAQLTREFVEMADTMALLGARLQLATGGGENFVKSQKAIYEIAQANNVGLQETTTLYTKLLGSVQRMGGGVEENTAIVKAFSSALRVGGANTQEAASATLQFAQAMASGVLRGEEFNAINEASPRIMEALAKGMGAPIGQLRQMAQDGKLTADVVGNALINQLSALSAEAAQMPDTVGGAFQRIKNDVALMVSELNEARGITLSLADAMGTFGALVIDLAQAFRVWGSATQKTSSDLDGVAVAIRVIGTVMEALIVLSSDVVFVFKAVGREIGGIIAQFSAIGEAGGVFTKEGRAAWTQVGQMMRDDAAAAREELDRFQKSVLGSTDRVLQQRDALKNHSLSAAENTNELTRLGNAHGVVSIKTLQSSGATKEAKQVVDQAAKAGQDYLATLNLQFAAMNQQITMGRELTEAEKEQEKFTELLRSGKVRMTEADQAGTRAKIDLIGQLKEEIAQKKELDKTMADVAAATTKYEKALFEETDQMRKANVELREQNEKLGLSERELVARESAVLRATATDKLFEAQQQGGNYQLEEQARLLNERANLLEQGVVVKEAKAAADEWKKTTDSINDGLTDALMRGFESGKDIFESFKDTLVNAFKTMVLQPTIKAILAPVSGALGSLFSGNAMAGTGGGAGGLMSSVSNLFNGNTIGSTLGNYGSFGAESIGNWLVNNTTGSLNSLGGSLMQNSGMIGSGLGMLGNGMAGFGISSALSGGYSLGGKNLVNGIAGIASMIPGIGPIAGVVGGLVNRAFGRKAKEMKDYGLEGSITGGDATGRTYQDWFQKGGWFRSNKSGTDYSAMSDDMAAALDLGAKGVLEQTKAWAAALSLPAESLSKVTANFKVKLTEDEKANQEAINLVFEGYSNALTQQFDAVLAPFQKAGEKLSDTMARLSAVQAFSESINEFGGVFSRVAGASLAARENIIALAGGIDQLMAKAGQFVKDYYTTGEQAGLQARDTLKLFESLGISGAGITSRDDFRRLVESIDVSTEQGQKQLVALLDIAPTFAALADYIKEQKTTLEDVARQAPVVAVLDQMLPEQISTTDAVTDVAERIKEGNAVLTAIESAIRDGNVSIASGMAALAAATQTVAELQARVAASTAATAKAVTNANADTALASSAPTFTYDIGGDYAFAGN